MILTQKTFRENSTSKDINLKSGRIIALNMASQSQDKMFLEVILRQFPWGRCTKKLPENDLRNESFGLVRVYPLSVLLISLACLHITALLASRHFEMEFVERIWKFCSFRIGLAGKYGHSSACKGIRITINEKSCMSRWKWPETPRYRASSLSLLEFVENSFETRNPSSLDGVRENLDD